MSLNKVKNIRFANAKLVSSDGVIQFDVNGVAEIESEEFYNELLEIPGFEPFEGAIILGETEDSQPETDDTQEEAEEPEKDTQAQAEPEVEDEEENEDDGLTEEKLQEKSIKQLLYLAKLKKIEVNPNLKKAEIIQTILNN